MVHLDHGRIPFDHKFRFEFPNFHMLNGTVFSARPERSHSIPAWAHFLPRITQQNAKGSWWSDSLKCSKLLHVEKLTRIQNSTLPWYLLDQTRHVRWEELTNFPCGREYANRVNWPTRNSEWPVHNFTGNQILSFLRITGNQEQARAVTDHFAFSVVSAQKTCCHLVHVAFHD